MLRLEERGPEEGLVGAAPPPLPPPPREYRPPVRPLPRAEGLPRRVLDEECFSKREALWVPRELGEDFFVVVVVERGARLREDAVDLVEDPVCVAGVGLRAHEGVPSCPVVDGEERGRGRRAEDEDNRDAGEVLRVDDVEQGPGDDRGGDDG